MDSARRATNDENKIDSAQKIRVATLKEMEICTSDELAGWLAGWLARSLMGHQFNMTAALCN